MSSVTNFTGAARDRPSRYDVDRVVADARQADPSLAEETARQLAEAAGPHLLAGCVDAPGLARRLLEAFPEQGATSANVVAVAAASSWSAADG